MISWTASSTFSRTVRPSLSGGSCWSMPTVAPGSRIASPLLARSRPAMILSSDDLPVPLGPTTPIFAPCRNDNVTLSRTTLSPWALRTLRRVNTYSDMPASLRGEGARSPIRPRWSCSRRRRLARPAVRVELRPVGVEAVHQLLDLLAVLGGVGALLSADPQELAGALAEVVPDEARFDHVGHRRRLALALPDIDPHSAVNHHRVALVHRGGDVVAERAPGVDGVPGGLSVDPHAVAEVARRAPHPERRHPGPPCLTRVDLATDPALQGHPRLVHLRLLSSCRTTSQPRALDVREGRLAPCGRRPTSGVLWRRAGSGFRGTRPCQGALHPVRTPASRGLGAPLRPAREGAPRGPAGRRRAPRR